MKNLLKTLPLIVLFLLSAPAIAMNGLDINSKEEMTLLGKVYGCEIHFIEQGEDRKAGVFGIVTGEEFDSDWNKMRNQYVQDAMIDTVYQLSSGNAKMLAMCNTAYKRFVASL